MFIGQSKSITSLCFCIGKKNKKNHEQKIMQKYVVVQKNKQKLNEKKNLTNRNKCKYLNKNEN